MREQNAFVSAECRQVSWFFMVIVAPIQVANLGIADSLLLMVLALVVFGPRRLPEIGRKIGKLMYEFRKASNDFKFQMEEELRNSEEAERRKALEAQQAEDHKRLLALEEKARQNESGTETPVNKEAELAAAAEASADAPDPTLRIQPPATGEPVQAARPGTVADAANAMAEMDAATPVMQESQVQEIAPQESTAQDSSAAPEPTAHHG